MQSYRVGIIVPKFNNKIQKRYSFPVGLAYIKGVLSANGYEVKGLNLNHHWGNIEQTVKDWLEENKIKIVMTGGLTADYHRLKDIFTWTKEYDSNIITIGGGGGFSSEPILFSEMTGVDYACIGEGEITICELMKTIVSGKMDDCHRLKGIVWQEKGVYRENAPQEYISDLDSVPFPDYSDLGMEQYLDEQNTYDYYYTYSHDEPRMFPMYLGRSCPFSCTFCYHPLGNKYRQRSLDNFFAELDEVLVKYNINELGVFDELFSLKKDNIEKFCRRIEKYHLKWHIQLRVNIVDSSMLDMMKKAGCASISYGIESFNSDVLASMQKKITQSEIETALEDTYNAGITIQGNFIFGDAKETLASFSETLNWWRHHRKYQLNLAFIETYPGTVLYKNAVASGLIKDAKSFIEDNCPIINMTSLSDEQFEMMRTIVALEEYKDSSCNGRVISISDNTKESDYVEAALECAHCGNQSTYRRIEKMRIYSNHFKICCRHCGQKSVFDTRAYLGVRDSEFKYKMYFYVIRQYMMSMHNNYFKQFADKFQRIAIWYNDELGRVLIERLLELENLSYIIDDTKNRYISAMANIKIVQLSELSRIDAEYPTDVLVVMDIIDFVNKSEYLRQNGFAGKIVSADDIICGFSDV